jgi:acetoacetyl-CoA synthetase
MSETRSGDLLWVPDEDRVVRSQISSFRADVADRAGSSDPDDVHRWSVEHPEQFWAEVAHRAVRFGRIDQPIQVAQQQPPGATFFAHAQVCVAEELMGGGSVPGAGSVALVYHREDGWREDYTWTELHSAAHRYGSALADLGVGVGDRVAAWLPNCPEAVIAMLATQLLGGVFTSASPDFGPQALADRFAQVEPKVLFVADGYVYGGRQHQRAELLPEVLDLLPSVTAVVVVDELARGVDNARATGLPAQLGQRHPDLRIVSASGLPAGDPLTPVHVPYDHPGVILYSSGTTGRPKCLVHSGLGLLVKHWTEHALHSDIHAGDVVFFYTTTGWMMWNWLVGALACGATVVLYDGSPLAPSPSRLWEIAAAEGVTFFGAGAKFYDACRAADLQPGKEWPNPALRTIASTGSPLAPADFGYLYRQWGTAVHLASISGGTDICGCFVLGDPTAPVYAGEIQTPALGVEVDVVDTHGDSLRSHPGERGDLICRNVLPSMPLRFWGDDDGVAYRKAYFSGFPNVWTHGDFAEWTEHGGIVISGRSDATLNVGGVRIGTAEIYRQLVDFPIVEALAVAQDTAENSRVMLFVQMAEGRVLDDDLRSAIRARVRAGASPRHVPALIESAPDLPRTRSGKLAELVVADIVNGRQVRAATGLANPQALDWFSANYGDHGLSPHIAE